MKKYGKSGKIVKLILDYWHAVRYNVDTIKERR